MLKIYLSGVYAADAATATATATATTLVLLQLLLLLLLLPLLLLELLLLLLLLVLLLLHPLLLLLLLPLHLLLQLLLRQRLQVLYMSMGYSCIQKSSFARWYRAIEPIGTTVCSKRATALICGLKMSCYDSDNGVK